jgi:hypothetical protein
VARAQAFACTPGDRIEELHPMLAASACRFILGKAGRYTPPGHNTAMDQKGDTHVAPAAEGHRGTWLR